MNRIENIQLPSSYPSDEAIESFGQNRHNYEPEFWEFQYNVYRYLENLNTIELQQRYDAIKENFNAFTETKRDIVPINSFLSSWYWYRKEHQTRYEMNLRGIADQLILPIPSLMISRPYSTELKNSCNLLFRYGNSRYLKDFYKNGLIRITSALKYKDGAEKDPRTDNELEKTKWLPGKHVKLTSMDGRIMPIIGDVKSTISSSSYYTLCLSNEFNNYMFDKFSYDSCIVIYDRVVFEERLNNVVRNVLPGWHNISFPIEYYDPYERTSPKEFFMASICKRFEFAYQKEYRIIWDSFSDIKINDSIDINIGPLNDICELYIKRNA